MAGGAFPGLLPWPKVDFEKFGGPSSARDGPDQEDLRRQPAPQLGDPHVTNHDEADITELEAFRVQLNKENERAASR